MSDQYVTTRSVPAVLIPWIETRLPDFARSIRVIHTAENDDAPVRYRAHRSEISILRRAIRSAKLAYEVRHIH
jgi:hypothetical protein